ncbi:hypothetical protein J3B02_006289 [Coemansia erecta]|uniref:Uncharacterized protein n=1 Tax=Coemansia asiatica TaxID=1052880 RepID=A0A9W8CL68_9FUNG|nr:hypothetical protein LPJ64_002204 [Coemansia asiatica]KAJ2839677.1 hypothetical protein J3B02_006289 [Coemansia erecta]KAJ2854003.1 hypothetical protein FB639_006443 [Coemansia asiatica]
MRSFTAIVFAASAVLAQEIGFSGGPSVSSGTNGISNPNVNNGWQSDSSLFSGGESAGVNTFNNVAGSSFTNVNANSAVKDNIINNPSFAAVKGNNGWTANGDANNLGPVQNLFGAAGAGVFRRSGDVVFADSHHQIQQAPVAPVHFVQPQFSAPFFAQPQFVAGAVVKRNGDVVFADNHHQIDSFVPTVAFAQQAVPVFQHQPVVAIQPIVHHAVAPVVAEQNGQKATIVQNQV